MRQMTRDNFFTTLITIPSVWRRYLPLWCVLLLLTMTPWNTLGRDLDVDEVFTVSYTAHPTPALVLDDVRKNEETPPLYFLLTWCWAQLFGGGAVAIRTFSLLCGLLAVALFAQFALRRFAPVEAFVAGTILAASPLVSRFLVEARGYTLTLLLAVVCVVTFERFYRHPEHVSALVVYTLSATTLFFTSYFGAALIGAQNLIWLVLLFRQRESWRRNLLVWCVAQALIGAVVLVWLPTLAYQIKVAPAVSPYHDSRPDQYFWLALMLITSVPPSTLWLVVWLLLAVLVWEMLAFGLIASREHDDGLILRAFGAPTIVLLGLIIWLESIGPRYLMVIMPGAALGVAAGWSTLCRRLPRSGPLMGWMLMVALLAYGLLGAPAPKAITPWSDLVGYMAQRADSAGEVVLLHPALNQRMFEYYYSGPSLRLLGAHDYDEFYYVQGHDLRTAWTSADAQMATRGSRRVWLVYDTAIGTPRLNLPYPLLDRRQFDTLEVYLYRVPGG